MQKILLNRGININMDSDGILSYLFLLCGGFKNNINGFTNSCDIILSTENNVENMWKRSVFIDIYTPKEFVKSVDQHIIHTHKQAINKNKLNPHINIEPHYGCSPSYRTKYPYSTCMFILSTLERDGYITKNMNLTKPLIGKNKSLHNITLCDLILRADGVLDNAREDKYRENCKNWARKTYNFSKHGINTKEILSYLFLLNQNELIEKNDIIEQFYLDYGLTKDGGYNYKIRIEDNISLIMDIMRAFAKYLDIELKQTSKTFNVYKGIPHRKEIKNDIGFEQFDTYAFIAKNKISYTTDFSYTGNKIESKIFE